MFEKEEERLKAMKTGLEQMKLPLDEADQAIMQGFQQAQNKQRNKRRKRKRVTWTFLAAALVFITFVTSIRVSPAFANAVASIPGMEKFVEVINMDKGLNAAFENDYYQEINASQAKNDLTLTVNGVILDESGINIFYNIESDTPFTQISVESFKLKNAEDIPVGTLSYNSPMNDEETTVYHDRIDINFVKSKRFNDLHFDFEVEAKVDGEIASFAVPFTVPNNVQSSKTYVLTKEVEFHSQKMTIEEVTIHPLRTGVILSVDPSNTMEILQLIDMRLEDENGEVWGSIVNGTTAMTDDDGNRIYFLQSNYFTEPKKLYLRINKVQALSKEDAIVVVDTEKEELLQSPAKPELKLVSASKSKVHLEIPHINQEKFPFQLVNKITDADGKEIGMPSTGMYNEDDASQWDMELDRTDYKNPLYLNLFAYPHYVEGDVKVEIK